MKKRILSTVLLSAMSLGNANATLTLDITGVAGSGQTTWSFSGSSVATGSGHFKELNHLRNVNTWSDLGEFNDLDDHEVFGADIISSSATLGVNADIRNIDLVYADSDGAFGSGNDDIGVGIDGASNLLFNALDVVSWSGSLVANVDINDMNNTGLPFLFSTAKYGTRDNILAIQGTISAVSATVPTPSAFLFMSAGLVGLLVSNRKKKNIV